MLNVEGACYCETLVPTEERACFLGLDCLLADPTTKAVPYWRNLGFHPKGGDIWARHPVLKVDSKSGAEVSKGKN